MKQKHRAAVLFSAGKIQIDERAFPPLQPSEVVIRVQFAGVCGTDLALFSGDYRVPLPSVDCPRQVLILRSWWLMK